MTEGFKTRTLWEQPLFTTTIYMGGGVMEDFFGAIFSSLPFLNTYKIMAPPPRTKKILWPSFFFKFNDGTNHGAFKCVK